MGRNSSIELFRLVLMFMIIVHHSIVHGLGLRGDLLDNQISTHIGYVCNLENTEYLVSFLVNSFCICAVNCFVLISGYFSIRISSTKFFSLCATVLFYTLFFNSVDLFLKGEFVGGGKLLLFFSHPTYWFINCYIYLFILAPLLNMLFDTMNKSYQYLFILFLLFVSSYLGFIYGNSLNPTGYNLFQMITMYSIGRFIRNNHFRQAKSTSLMGYIILSLVIGLSAFFLWKMNLSRFAWHLSYYNNPLLIISSVCLFLFVRSFDFKNENINKYAGSALAIYMIQSSMMMSQAYYSFINSLHNYMGYAIYIVIFISAICIIIFSILVDRIIQKPVNHILTRIFQYVYDKALLTS